jgi:hypothetical protein
MAAEAIPESGCRDPTFEPRAVSSSRLEARNQLDLQRFEMQRKSWPGACKRPRFMSTARFIRAAVLAALAIVLDVAAQAAAPFRLFDLPVSRFTRLDDGTTRLEQAMLNAKGEVRVTGTFIVTTPPRTSDAAFGRLLVSSEAWFAYQALGPQALANFNRLNDGVPVTVGGIPHYVVGEDTAARLNVGQVINLSTRGVVGPDASSALVGGFVIEGEWRRVLIRAVGPSLGAFGVTDALADPVVQLQRGTLPLYVNSDWGQRPDADELERTAAEAGAFPLSRGSKDAALLVELPPGNYTASVASESVPATGGTALLEIYVLP